MNSGKFFQLNLKESKVVNGVAIYDYIDLPAYFGDSEKISPKYPVRLVITSDSVRFSVHYCAFKHTAEEFVYNLDQSKIRITSPDTIHAQAVILELPFANNSMKPVSTVVKQSYSTLFPGVDDHYFGQLLDRRYNCAAGPYKAVYEALRRDVDSDRCFSSLWLMDIRLDMGDGRYSVNLLDKNNQYVAFLRKLLLDFMFDLRHSEVFQTCGHYDKMYSGLMADFFFSALMHKCDYYYYRGLIRDAINISTDKATDNLKELYFNKLFEAEREWVNDILNPIADNHFIHEDDYQSTNTFWKSLGTWINENIIEASHSLCFTTRNSWFADPEEEMRRVCFTMPEIIRNKKKLPTRIVPHICNAETVADYLGIKKRTGIIRMKTMISRWFLKRSAFSDVLHLHGFSFISWLLPFFLFLITLQIIFIPTFLSQEAWLGNSSVKIATAISWILLVALSLWLWLVNPGKKLFIDKLYLHRRWLSAKRLFMWLMPFCVISTMLYAAILHLASSTVLISAMILSIIVLLILFFFKPSGIISNIHLLLPRLIASITAAWFTLAIGNELFSSFFDVIPSWISCSLLSLVVLVFIIYETNKIIPTKTSTIIFLRSFELLVLSYFLSFMIGLFMINFMGERFLERSDYLETFYHEYIEGVDSLTTVDMYRQVYQFDNSVDSIVDGAKLKNRDYLENLSRIAISQQNSIIPQIHGQEPVVTYWTIGKYKFFILRGFLIQFAFLAMFIGIFIQMIFEEKTITEL